MSLHEAGRPGERSILEHGVCFGTAVLALALVAMALQWIVGAIL